MNKTLELVKINSNYCDYLRKYDEKVPYNKNTKELRPFVGILFVVHDCEYFAPLSSPKPKHMQMKNNLDFYKINNGIFGVVNFNNMIPVTKDCYEIINLNEKVKTTKETEYIELLKNQLKYLNKNYIELKSKAFKLYELYINNKLPENIKIRCCNFKLLEEKCEEYEQEKIKS